jgi:hypothetical protein
MADNFEEAKDEILLRTDSNGGPSNRDMLKAMGALAKDVDNAVAGLDKKMTAQHEESVAAMKEHISYANVRDEGIAELQEWRRRSSETCVARVREIAAEVAAELHGPTHQLHMAEFHGRREDDPADSEFLEVRESAHPQPDADATTILELVRGWTAFKKVAWLIISTAVAGTILFGISYYGSLWASDRAEHNFVHSEQTMLPTPTVTVTVAP